MPSSPTYLTYLNFAENWVSLFFKLITIFFMGRLIFCVQFRPRAVRISHLSASMYVYLSTHIVGSIISLPYVIYKLLWWKIPSDSRTVQGIYDPYTLFWMGVIEMSYSPTAPIVALFLTLDRICVLKPLEWIGQMRKKLTILSIILVPATFLCSFGLYLLELPLNFATASFCQLSACEMDKYKSLPQLFLKMSVGTLNIVSCIVFVYLLRKITNKNKTGSIQSHANANAKNRVVTIVILCEIFADLVPTYCAYAFNLIVQRSLSTYVGNTVGLGVQIEATICAVVYWRLFRAQQNNGVRIANTTVGEFKSRGEDLQKAQCTRAPNLNSNCSANVEVKQQNANANESVCRQAHILEIDLEKGNRKKSAKNVSMEMKNLNSDYVLTMPNAVS